MGLRYRSSFVFCRSDFKRKINPDYFLLRMHKVIEMKKAEMMLISNLTS